MFGSGRLTGLGSVLGTAEFMAPEQADGRAVDPRSDLYSLGGVLYVLLARRPLYNARSFAEMLDKQRFEKPAPLRQFAADIPVELEQIIHRLLEKEPDRRFATAMVLERRLETMLESFSRVAARRCDACHGRSGAAGSPAGVDPPPVDPLAQTIAATQAPDHPALPIAPPPGSRLPETVSPRPETARRRHRGIAAANRRRGPRAASFRFGPASLTPRRRIGPRARGFRRKPGPW